MFLLHMFASMWGLVSAESMEEMQYKYYWKVFSYIPVASEVIIKFKKFHFLKHNAQLDNTLKIKLLFFVSM